MIVNIKSRLLLNQELIISKPALIFLRYEKLLKK
jgi:hypothetical protein